MDIEAEGGRVEWIDKMRGRDVGAERVADRKKERRRSEEGEKVEQEIGTSYRGKTQEQCRPT